MADAGEPAKRKKTENENADECELRADVLNTVVPPTDVGRAAEIPTAAAVPVLANEPSADPAKPLSKNQQKKAKRLADSRMKMQYKRKVRSNAGREELRVLAVQREEEIEEAETLRADEHFGGDIALLKADERYRRAPNVAKDMIARWEQADRKKQQAREAREAQTAAGGGGGEDSKTPETEDATKARTRSRQNIRRNAEEHAALCLSGATLVVDCAFHGDLSRKEAVSLSQQIMYMYGANRRAQVPIRLSVTGVGDVLQTAFNKNQAQNWAGVEIHHEQLEAVYEDVSKLVYLTADSENVLETFEVDKCYIMGGIVDRNRMKGASFEKAKRLGIAHARFPISEVGIELSKSNVLALNHAGDVMLKWLELRDWNSALREALPPRAIVDPPDNKAMVAQPE